MARPYLFMTTLALFACADDVSEPSECIDGIRTVEGPITTSTEWNADDCPVVVLQGEVEVGVDLVADPDGQPVMLSIGAGMTVLGETLATLNVNPGNTILVNGTVDAPVIMSSAEPEGARGAGDWGGLILNGDDTLDSSGSLQYLRVEFAGAPQASDTPPAGLSLRGVGAGTQVDFVQVHRSNGDGVSMVGGTVGLKHLVVTDSDLEGLDWTDGWTGNGQFIVVRTSGGAGGIAGSGESAPVLSNLTVVSSPESIQGDVGVQLREGTAGQLWNAQVQGFASGLLIESPETVSELLGGGITMANVRLDCDDNFVVGKDVTWTAADLETWFAEGSGNVEGPGATDIADAFALVPDFSTVFTGALLPDDWWFDDTEIIGVTGASDDWTAGWTAYPDN